MLTLITCPTCQHKFSVAEGSMGQRSTCPNCQSIFVAGKSVAESNGRLNGNSRKGLLERAANDAPAVKGPLDQTMLGETAAPAPPIRYNCPRCKKPLEAPANEAGTKKPCPSCGGRLQVPAAPPPAPTIDPLNKTLLAEGTPTPPPPTPATPSWSAATPVSAAAIASVAPPPKDPTRAYKYVIAGLVAVGVLFAVLYFVGKTGANNEYEKMLQAQKTELDKLRAEIDQKTTAFTQQQQLEAQQRKAWDEQRAKQEARQRELDRERELELQRLAILNDQKQAADARARLDAKQRELEAERRAAAEQQARSERETREQLEALKRQLENANKQQTTIIQAPPPPVHPWWHYYRHPYGW